MPIRRTCRAGPLLRLSALLLLVPLLTADRCNPIGPIDSQSAAWLPDGRIVFVRNGGSPDAHWTNRLYVMGPDGDHVVPLADSVADDVVGVHPSPDGRRVALESADSGRWDLYVVRVDGGGVTHIGDGTGPSWSPDGRRLAFVHRDLVAGKRAFHVYVADADGAHVRRLLEGNIVSWSPNGLLLAVVAFGDSTSTVRVLAAAGTHVRTLAVVSGQAGKPLWSPDSRWIADAHTPPHSLHESTELRLLDAAQGGERVLLQNVRMRGDPAWSPDSRRVAVGGATPDGRGVAYAVGVPRGDRVLLDRADEWLAQPAWSPNGARVALVYGGVRSALRVARADGRGSSTVATVCHPPDSPAAWSPDGRALLFSGYCDGGWELYVVRGALDGLDGTTRLTWGAWMNAEPAWSPDGRHLAFTRSAGGDIWDVETGTVLVATPENDRVASVAPGIEPAWSPDGARLAFVARANGRTSVQIADADGGNRRALVPSPHWPIDSTEERVPTWAPDGGHVAFAVRTSNWSSAGSIQVAEVTAGAVRPLLTSPAWSGDSIHADYPVWSPDGSRIAFWAELPRKAPGIYVVPARGGEPVRITPDDRAAMQPVWSPDGRRIALTLSTTKENQLENPSELWLADADGSHRRQLTDPEGFIAMPAWSPDGQRIAFARLSSKTLRLFVVDVAGGKERRLTDDPVLQWGAVWSPDGRWIAFVSERGGNANLWMLHPDGTGLRQLTRPPSGTGWKLGAPAARGTGSAVRSAR